MDELVTTERTYVNLLDGLIINYVNKLKDSSIITRNQYAALFPSDIITIHNCNKTFLQDLEKLHKTWNNSTSKLSPLIQSFVPYFRMYQNYVNNHEKSTTILTQLNQTNAKFLEHEQSVQSSCGNLRLSGLLILPIQRIPRYEILLKEIIKNTPKNHIDLNGLNESLNKVKDVSTAINDRMKENERRKKVREVETRFGGTVALVAPARQFVKEGMLCKIERKADSDYMFFLFSDCLVYGMEQGFITKSALKFKNLLPIDVAFRVRESRSSQTPHCFEVMHFFFFFRVCFKII